MSKNYNRSTANRSCDDGPSIPSFMNERLVEPRRRHSNARNFIAAKAMDDGLDVITFTNNSDSYRGAKIIQLADYRRDYQQKSPVDQTELERQQRREARQNKREQEQREKNKRAKSWLGKIAITAVAAGTIIAGASVIREDIMHPVASPSGEYVEVSRTGYWDTVVDITNDFNEKHPGMFDGNLTANQVMYDIKQLNKEKLDPDGDGSTDTIPKGTHLEMPKYDGDLEW